MVKEEQAAFNEEKKVSSPDKKEGYISPDKKEGYIPASPSGIVPTSYRKSLAVIWKMPVCHRKNKLEKSLAV